MRPVQSRRVSYRPWFLAACAAMPLLGCGGEPATPKPAAPEGSAHEAAAPATAAKSSDPAAPQGTTLPLGDQIMPLASTVEGPVEYEKAVDKPIAVSFPEEVPNESPRPKIEGLPDDDELLGKPLVINGRLVPFAEIKRQVCLGPIGVTEIEQAKLSVFLSEEVQRRMNAGESPEALRVGDAEMDEYLQDIQAQIKEEFPGGEVTLDDWFAGMFSSAPRERLRVERLFEKLMLPDDPSKFPPLTVEAIMKNPGGDEVIEQYKSMYAERMAKKESDTERQARRRDLAQRQFDEAIMQQIHEYLIATAQIERDPAPGVLVRVNGVDITVDGIWERIKPLMTTMEVRAAKQWIVNSTLVREALQKAGAWLSDDEAEAAYKAFSDPYKDSVFSQERVAVMVERFPSVERYKEYRRMWDSYLKYKQPEMTPEALKAHAEYRTNKMVGQVTVDVDVLLCAAFDLKGNRWIENGWELSENRMKDVVSLLIDKQRPWEELVEKYSDFYRPPTPVSAAGQAEEQPEKGRFRNIQRNNLLTELGESEYGIFLNGSSITDSIFYEQEVGTVGTPMRGPLGWYMPRLLRRSKAPRKITMKEETLQELIRDDYMAYNLAHFAQDLLTKNEVYGLELPRR